MRAHPTQIRSQQYREQGILGSLRRHGRRALVNANAVCADPGTCWRMVSRPPGLWYHSNSRTDRLEPVA
jgi:hypothetical protein